MRLVRGFFTLPAVGALCLWILMFVALMQLRGPLAPLGDWGYGGIFLIGLVCGIATALVELTGYMLGTRTQAGYPYGRLLAHLRRWGDPCLFTFAILPGPFTVVSMWAGTVRYPIWRFILCVTAGKVTKLTAIAFVGYYSFPWLFQPVG